MKNEKNRIKTLFMMSIVFSVLFGYSFNSFWNSTSMKLMLMSLAFMLPSLIGTYVSFKGILLSLSRDYKKIGEGVNLQEKVKI